MNRLPSGSLFRFVHVLVDMTGELRPNVRLNKFPKNEMTAVVSRLTRAVMDIVLAELSSAEIESLPRRILVRKDKTGPMAVYNDPAAKAPALILINSSERHWSQYVYQLSHELGHVLCNFRRNDLGVNRFQWLEEALCGAMSLFVMERLAANWPIGPGEDGAHYAPSVADYAQERRRIYALHSRITNLRAWYLAHFEALCETRGFVAINQPASIWLADRFHEEPSLIASMRYLNVWPNDRSASLTEYLLRWKRHCLAGREGLPALLAREFAMVP